MPRTEALPLSFAQQRLWFLDQLEPQGAFHNVPAALRLQGLLDVTALERAFAELFRRHEALRTVFRAQEGRPLHVILPVPESPVSRQDLRGLPELAREEEALRQAQEEARRPFDLARGPLLRVTLLQLAERQHLLLLTMHHIVSDGWSMSVLVRELVALYEAFRTGKPSPLPELPLQYADYAAWQRQWLEQGALAQQLAWWKRQLDGAPQTVDLPTDRPRPTVQSHKGEQLQVLVPPEVMTRLQALCRREGVTLFMALLAGFQVVLSRYTRRTDIVVGTDIANRNRAETEGLIGFFVNQLVLRGDLGGDPTVRELLSRARETALSAYAHQDLPFEELVKELNPKRSLGQAPLFQVKLVLQNAPVSRLELPGLELSPVGQEATRAKLDLTVAVQETPQGLACVWEYATDLFDGDTVARMAKHFEQALEGLSREASRRLSSLSLLTDAERHTLLDAWNDTRTEVLPGPTATALFEAQAARTPDALAAVYGDTSLTYAQLDAKANQLAWHLKQSGVGLESRVGLCVERSLDMAVGILGILKAGAAYLPLDPTYPSDRLAYMLADAAVPVIVTQDALADELPVQGELLVCLDSDAARIAKHPVTKPPVKLEPEHLAYVIYTSGSTGRPKGTLLHHRGLCNTATAAIAALGITPSSRVLQFAAFGFDASVWETFSALLGGAALHLAPREALLPGAPLHGLIASSGITTVTLTPSVLAQLEPEGLPLLTSVAAAGEACSAELVRRWSPGRRFLNAYGPTEVTVCATVRANVDPARPTIGTPLPNVRVYVLDDQGQPVPVCVPGQLHVGGVGLARGYLHRSDLTAERFVPDAFGPEAGGRLYATGDLVRYLPSGELEFLGRIDHQLKLRGYRIELGEVEAAIADHPAVESTVVLLREDVPGNPRLVAYVVPREGQVLDLRALKDALLARLPEYMVPAAFVSLQALPLTPNGKLDRQSLPVPDTQRPELEKGYVAPRDELEQQLADIWSELLGVKQVGVHDDFFELGGHSLLGTQLISRIRTTFDVELPLRDIFESPTVENLAVHIVQAQAAQADPAELERLMGSWSTCPPKRRKRSSPPTKCPPTTSSPRTPRRSPAMSSDADKRIAALSPEKRALLLKQLRQQQQQGARPARAPAIARRPRDGSPLPLSFAQQRLWFLDQLEPDSALYNIPLAIELKGELKLEALEQAFTALQERHESLRTTFRTVEGTPVQVIAPPSPVTLEVADLRGVAVPERQDELSRRVREESLRPFHLGRGPLVRASLVRTGDEEHVLLVTMHHVISDGWSMGVVIRELASLYDAYLHGRPSPLPPLELQYPDYAAWQREWLQGETLKAQLDWWKQQLEGAPDVIALPTDRPRPAIQSSRGAKHFVQLPRAVSEALKALGQKEGATPFMTLLAAWQVLLARYTGQDDISVGTPIAGRNRAELEGLIGFFINTLVLRAKVNAGMTFRQVLAHVREQALGAYAHQDVPFEKLVDLLQPVRTLSHSPLFQVMFSLQNAPVSELVLPDVALRTLRVEAQTTKFELTLSLSDTPEGFSGSIEYNTDLFDAGTV
ncbi:amino acid adenylation domain-containing protein, partial [Corallococcus sp. 4LFB]|uniref:amino acid adenylation domain-containing protein n=1 Tax=Corallococcus sp. 4LFB TaxID=3383249 RepID=UPI003975ACD1